MLISAGVETVGLQLLLQGVGFSAGFFMVIISRTLLFSETNVILPASLLNCTKKGLAQGALKFWTIAIIGNAMGAWLVGMCIHACQVYPDEVLTMLSSVVEKKMYYLRQGEAVNWMQALISGIFGNWLVGIAAIFGLMGRTIIGKYIPVLLAVSIFVAANFQHSPANMGYFSLIMPTGIGPGWVDAVRWNLLPAAIGNVAGGIFLVALPFYYALTEREQRQL